MDLWLISGDEPPANEMVFSSKSFHLRKQKSTVNTSCRRTVQRNISESWRRTGTLSEPSSRKRRVVGKILRVFLWWSPGHQLVDLPLCGADDVEGFVVCKEITSLNVIKTTRTHKKKKTLKCAFLGVTTVLPVATERTNSESSFTSGLKEVLLSPLPPPPPPSQRDGYLSCSRSSGPLCRRTRQSDSSSAWISDGGEEIQRCVMTGVWD